jgi:hypothetical protein
MFDQLNAAIDELDVPLEHDAMIEYLRLCDRFEARRAAIIGEFETSQQWALVGSVSVTQWLMGYGRLAGDDIHRMRALARCIRLFPVTAQAYQTGDFSTAQVRAIAANVSAEAEDIFAEHEAELVPVLIPLSNRSTNTALKQWKQRADALLDDGKPTEPKPSHAHHSQLGNDRWRTDATFDLKDGQLIQDAINLAISDDVDGEPARTHPQKVADALTDICRYFLDHQEIQQSPGGDLTSPPT